MVRRSKSGSAMAEYLSMKAENSFRTPEGDGLGAEYEGNQAPE